MEKIEKKIGWFAKLLFGKHCLMPGYSRHLDFYKEMAEFNQRREDEFVESEIERLAQEQYRDYVLEKQKWDKIAESVKDPDVKKMCFPIIVEKAHGHCYHVYNEATAKFLKINIGEQVQKRYNELLNAASTL